ncbi:MAG TPA: SDR family oxidoreductase [Acidimicrobiia bacterium]|nr:SDR family oxidoreductase [Acidimicrobiia bacterium]
MAELDLQPESGVVITGGASGIGLATAHAVAEVGRPVAVWDLHQDRASAAADAVAAAHGVKTVGMAVDVRETDTLQDAAEETASAVGTIGGLVHAAGVPDAVDLPELTDKTWDPLLEVNLRAYAMVVQAFLSQLRANAPDAAVVGIASIHGIIAQGVNPAYAASKAGVLGLTRSMAVRFATEGIRVNAICPGFIDTPWFGRAMPAEALERMRAGVAASMPLKAASTAEDIAGAAVFLASPAARHITGETLLVDAGLHLGYAPLGMR